MILEEVVVWGFTRDTSIGDKKDAIARTHHRQSMSDEDYGVLAPESFQRGQQFGLGGVVQRRSALIEYENVGPPIQGSGDSARLLEW